MKLIKLLILLILPLFLVSCSKPNTNTDDNTENNTTEDGETLPDDGIDWDDPVWPK